MSKLEGLEFQRAGQIEAKELGESLARLEKSKDFKRVFTQELFQDFAAQCVMAKGNPSMANEAGQKAIDADISMLGHLNQRLNTMRIMGEGADDVIKSIDLEIEMLAAGELEE